MKRLTLIICLFAIFLLSSSITYSQSRSTNTTVIKNVSTFSYKGVTYSYSTSNVSRYNGIIYVNTTRYIYNTLYSSNYKSDKKYRYKQMPETKIVNGRSQAYWKGYNYGKVYMSNQPLFK